LRYRYIIATGGGRSVPIEMNSKLKKQNQFTKAWPSCKTGACHSRFKLAQRLNINRKELKPLIYYSFEGSQNISITGAFKMCLPSEQNSYEILSKWPIQSFHRIQPNSEIKNDHTQFNL